MTILDDIINYKRDEVIRAQNAVPLRELESIISAMRPVRGFETTLRRLKADEFALIAEIKKASPSKGLIRADFNPPALATSYQAGGAVCLSVLTDGPSFQGSPQILSDVREAVDLPILRKDFMIDPYQIAEARAWGADCVLLILACISDIQAAELASAARQFELDILIEIHSEDEAIRALDLGPAMIGVNNRDLRTFRTDIETTSRLAAHIPRDRLLVAESGINSHTDLIRLKAAGAGAFLVGESLMRQQDVEMATRSLLTGQDQSQ